MPVSIEKLPLVRLNYTAGGGGLHPGMSELRRLIDADRTGYLQLIVAVPGAEIPVVMARDDLYILGFQCAGQWLRFKDANWPFAEAAKSLGYGGQYAELGGLTGALVLGSINGMASLARPGERSKWPTALRTLLVVVSECARLIPVSMQVLGLLNRVCDKILLEPLAHYIQNWAKASGGEDMSKPSETPGFSTGFSDPTILKR